jgi:hypothetical protein
MLVIKSVRFGWAGHVTCMGEVKNACKILVGKPEWKTPRGKYRRRWEDKIRQDLKETEWESVDWIHLAQDRDKWWALMNTVISLRVP